MLTELTSSREDIIPTNASKTCACSDGETKGKECTLKITLTGIINLLECIANNKVYLRITGKHCGVEVTKESSTITADRADSCSLEEKCFGFWKKVLDFVQCRFVVSRR